MFFSQHTENVRYSQLYINTVTDLFLCNRYHMEWAMNEHHQPFEKYGIMALKGKNFGQLENWHLTGLSGLAQFSKGTGPRDSSCEASNQAASDHFVETTKMVV